MRLSNQPHPVRSHCCRLHFFWRDPRCARRASSAHSGVNWLVSTTIYRHASTDPQCKRTQRTLDSSMHSPRSVIAMILAAVCASGCSPSADSSGAASARASAPLSASSTESAANAGPTGPVDNVCALLTDAEIRHVFPDAASGKRNTESLQYGLDRCAWKTATGQIGVEASNVEAGAFENDLRGELQGAVDPRVNRALDRIQFHQVDGIGDHAVAVLEKADPQRGIYADITLLAIQRGHRMAVLMLNEGAPSSSSLDNLKDLGRKLAPRL